MRGGESDRGNTEPIDGQVPDLRPDSDACYKCAACDTECPVAEVDDGFPGPKFQGPEQWRLRRKHDVDIDESVMACSNCMRCDGACPAGVPLRRMHNEARSLYVDEKMPRISRTYVRNRLLANYGAIARIAAVVPRLGTAIIQNDIISHLTERVLGITAEREMPPFATQTFRRWWAERGGNTASAERARRRRRELGLDRDVEKRVAYFHGDYANYHTPEVAKSVTRVFEYFGYEVTVPRQRCSGTPMFANGFRSDAERVARANVSSLSAAVEQGYDIICSCTSCSMAIRQEYPELFDFEDTATVSTSTYDALEYLRLHEDLDNALAGSSARLPDLVYHAPCHARNQGLAGLPLDVFSDLDGLAVEDAGPSCSGISGTYGWKAERYETSMAIGRPMFEHMEAAEAETGLTDCPTCAMQMAHGTGYDIKHPMQMLALALDLDGFGTESEPDTYT